MENRGFSARKQRKKGEAIRESTRTFFLLCGESDEKKKIKKVVRVHTPVTAVEPGTDPPPARLFALSKLINVGSRIYPHYRCRGCHAAFRTLERAAESKGQAALEAFRTKRKKDVVSFNKEVEMVRMAHGDDKACTIPPETMAEQGVSTLAERKARVAQMAEEHYVALEDQAHEPVYYFTERQFKSYQRWWEGLTEREAETKWLEDASNPMIRKKYNRNGEMTVACRTAAYDDRCKSTGSKRALQQHSEADIDANSPEAITRFLHQSEHGQALTAVKDSVFEPGCASTGLPPPAPVQIIKKGARGTSQVVADMMSDGAGGATKESADSSACSASTSSKSRLSADFLGLLSKDNVQRAGVVKVRQYYLTEARAFLRNHFNIKKSHYKRILELEKKLGEGHDEVQALGVRDAMKSFEQDCERLRTDIAEATKWTMNDFVSIAHEALLVLKKCRSELEKLEKMQSTLADIRCLDVRRAASDRRKMALSCRQHTNTLKSQGLWANCVTWFGHHVLGLGSGEDGLGAPAPTNKSNDILQGKEAWQQFVHFGAPPSSNTPAVQLAFEKRLGFFLSRIEHAKAKMVEQRKLTKTDRCLTMLKTKAAELKDADYTEWAPAGWPKDIADAWFCKHGSPWVMEDTKMTLRMGLEDIPFDSLAGFLKVITGATIVFCWALDAVVEACADKPIIDVDNYMESFTVAEAGRFWDKNAAWRVVKQNEMIYKPTGIGMMCISLEDHTCLFWQPLHSNTFVEGCAFGEKLVQDLRHFYRSVDEEPFLSVAKSWQAEMGF